MYETDHDRAEIENEGVGSLVYRGHLITWRDGLYLTRGRLGPETKRSFGITGPEGASFRLGLFFVQDIDEAMGQVKLAVDRTIQFGPRALSLSDVERDVISGVGHVCFERDVLTRGRSVA